ncbi:hypothetical protein EXE30_05205 [Acinetobacter halotolerans]|uniref:Uncharacterized protein n=1 Tax=Acinetobacter halotolerans TaxID=1752076 RepID=A0A4Q6XHU7_9GAMM|nr:hypothetical protein [Acinetobacter halotolerans]RZF54623.1 hypothetical protein EXE30_05205 [Acinetobacter halotolerans]
MNNLSFNAQAFSKFIECQNNQLENTPFVKSSYSNPEEWGDSLRPFYIRELDVVDYDGRDSSFQYYLISNKNFKLKSSQYSELIKDLDESELLRFMDNKEGHSNFNRYIVYDKLFTLKESYRLSFYIIALEYRALIEAIKINKISKELEKTAILYCHRCLASSFNKNYHKI